MGSKYVTDAAPKSSFLKFLSTTSSHNTFFKISERGSYGKNRTMKQIK